MKKITVIISLILAVVILSALYIDSRPGLSAEQIENKAREVAVDRCLGVTSDRNRQVICSDLTLFNKRSNKGDFIARTPEYTTFYYSVGSFPDNFSTDVSVDKYGKLVDISKL